MFVIILPMFTLTRSRAILHSSTSAASTKMIPIAFENEAVCALHHSIRAVAKHGRRHTKQILRQGQRIRLLIRRSVITAASTRRHRRRSILMLIIFRIEILRVWHKVFNHEHIRVGDATKNTQMIADHGERVMNARNIHNIAISFRAQQSIVTQVLIMRHHTRRGLSIVALGVQLHTNTRQPSHRRCIENLQIGQKQRDVIAIAHCM
mmetsp:Transcript_17550/g.27520  ORF Transcript_17550/g.27520 Transcript_17550/m.27520 type:complete len:207 (-) Transcript_17550:365-985(-)